MARAAQHPYLEQRPEGFYFRRRLPGDIARILKIKKTAFRFSLRSNLPSDAMMRARSLTALFDLAFGLMRDRAMQHLTPANADLLTELARFRIAAFDAARAVAPPRSAEEAELAARMERLTQDTLRHALALGDRSPAKEALRDVAGRLGIRLNEETTEWQALAFEATRVLIDVSAECERRHVGLYDGPTVFFRSAMTADLAPRPLGASLATPLDRPLARLPRVQHAQPAETQSMPGTLPVQPAAMQPALPVGASQPAVPASAPPETAASPAQDHEDSAEGLFTEAPATSEATSSAASPGFQPLQSTRKEPSARSTFLFDITQLSAASQNNLQKGRRLTLAEACDLHIDLKSLGYGDEFGKRQKRNPTQGANWTRTSKANEQVSAAIWVDLLGNRPLDDIDVCEVEDALTVIVRLPATHGKGDELTATSGYRDLADRADELEEIRFRKAVEALRRNGMATEANIEQARLETLIPRIRVATFLKHGRTANRIGKMLKAMNLITQNPFEICRWTNAEERQMNKHQETRTRTIWDDRIFALFGSPVFQGKLRNPGDPLFWAPLIARFNGLREEEALQLGPKDFGTEDGIAYMHVRNCPGNHVKSTAGERRVPVHPRLIELGLLKLVELRRKEGQHRLFPEVKRGTSKQTLSETFTKAFTYYRKTNACYWPGLDFHALRTTFHADLLNDDKSDAIRRRLMGHEPLDEGEKSYAQGLKMKTLLDRLKSVQVDTSMIVSPFASPRSELHDRAAERGLRVV